MTLVTSLVQTNEGCELGCYTDTTGNPTVGIGYNLNADSANIASVGAGYAIGDLESCNVCMSYSDVQTLFQDTIQSAVSCAQGLLSNWNSLPVTAQAVAVDMSFNLGCGGFGSFVNTLASINSGNWNGAVAGMQDSQWCGQVGNRCTTDCNLMASSANCGSSDIASANANGNSNGSNNALVLGLSIPLSILGAAIIAAIIAAVIIRRRRLAANASSGVRPNGEALLETGYTKSQL